MTGPQQNNSNRCRQCRQARLDLEGTVGYPVSVDGLGLDMLAIILRHSLARRRYSTVEVNGGGLEVRRGTEVIQVSGDRLNGRSSPGYSPILQHRDPDFHAFMSNGLCRLLESRHGIDFDPSPYYEIGRMMEASVRD